VKPLTHDILAAVLASEKAWSKETLTPRMSYVIQTYYDLFDAWWIDNVTFPRALRAMHLLRLITSQPIKWEWAEPFPGVSGFWPVDTCIAEAIQERLDDYFHVLWYFTDLSPEPPSMEMITELGSKAPFKPKSKQLSLF
jgi:hypothetical protein